MPTTIIGLTKCGDTYVANNLYEAGKNKVNTLVGEVELRVFRTTPTPVTCSVMWVEEAIQAIIDNYIYTCLIPCHVGIISQHTNPNWKEGDPEWSKVCSESGEIKGSVDAGWFKWDKVLRLQDSTRPYDKFYGGIFVEEPGKGVDIKYEGK